MFDQKLARREFLTASTALAFSVPLMSCANHANTSRAPDRRYRIGFQSYTFRKFTPARTYETAKALGIRAIEFFPGHYPGDTPAEKIKEDAAASGMYLPSFGVVGLGTNAEANARYFQFAKNLGAGMLTADPETKPACLDSVEQLIRETGVKVGIHNHGPGSRYATPDDVLRSVKDRDERFGVCIDTGHSLRSRVAPEDFAKALAGRIHGVHLKDIRSHEDHTDAIFGQGLLNAGRFLEALKSGGFQGEIIIEYESRPEDPTDDVRACIDYLLREFPDDVRI